MIACIQQPNYFPYIGFFNKCINSDVCVILDDVEYSKNNFFNRNRIRIPNGWCWLTVPVSTFSNQHIKDIKINNSSNWKKKHYKSIVMNYKKCSYFKKIDPFLQDFYSHDWVLLAELDVYSVKMIMRILSIKAEFVLSSTLGVTTKRTQRLVDICKAVGADTYISGRGAKEYMEDNLFEENNIKLYYQNFKHPVYTQRFDNFESNLSILDLVLNYGKESTEIIKYAGGLI